MAKRRTKAKPKRSPVATSLLRAETVGSALVLLAFLTLLSLLSPNRGELTGALIGAMELAFGAGVWLMPVLLAALGLWLVLRNVTDQRWLSGRRIGAFLALFLIFEGLAHILLPAAETGANGAATGGGGAIGWVVGEGLKDALGLPVALVTLLLAAVAAVFILSGVTVEELQAAIRSLWEKLRGKTGDLRDSGGLRINPPLPFEEKEPLWRRLLKRTAGDNPWPPINGGFDDRHPAPVQPTTAGSGRYSALPNPREAPARGIVTPPVSPATLPVGQAAPAPRIIGSRGQMWRLPVLHEILEDSTEQDIQGDDLRQRAQVIEKTLEGFGVPVQVVEANQGPAVTQFGLRPGTIVRRNRKGEETRVKVRVSQIQALSNDLALALAASPIRIEAPVPGRDIVGVEVPNVQISLVALRGVMESEEFRQARGALPFALGRDVSGQSAIGDLARMPHLLIAGATGSGKSVCVNAIITTLLLTHTPDTLRFLMVDPKRVELTVYNGVPHLIAPVVVDVERAVQVLQWATREMDRRYKLFAKVGARNIETYNEKMAQRGEQLLPYVVILIDELADLMLSAPEDVERYICRIAQMARATGMHLVIATQRPSVDVVTGLIKANFPARIAFAVTSQVDSRVILDTPGAEQLLGRGDMLFMAPDASKLHRLQGCYVSDRETQRLVRYWKGVHTLEGGGESEAAAESDTLTATEGTETQLEAGELRPELPWLPGQETLQQPLWSEMLDMEQGTGERDEMYDQAVSEVRKSGRASVSLLQRRLRIGYSRAARLIDELESNGVIGPDLGGSRGREVLPERSGEDE